MKKSLIVSALTAIIICITSAAVCAETVMEQLSGAGVTETVYEQNFNKENSETDGVFPSVSSDAFVNDLGRERSLKLHKTETDGDLELQIQVPSTGEGKVIVTQSIMFGDTNLHRKIIGIMRDTTSTGNELYFLMADKNGNFVRQPTGEILMSYQENTWYDIVGVFDFNTKKFDLYINGTRVINNADFPNMNFSGVARIWLVKVWDKGAAGDVYIDDIGVYRYSPYPTAYFGEKVEYDADELNIEFTTPMDEASLDGGVILTDTEGNTVKTTGKLSQNGTVYTLMPKEVLKPANAYKISIAGSVCSADGMENRTPELEFTVNPAAVDEILFKKGNTDINQLSDAAGATLNVLCYSKSEEKKPFMLIAALYKDNKLIKLISKKDELSFGERIFAGLSIPQNCEGCSVRAFVWDNSKNQAAYIKDAEFK